jgi:hypothetical protein
VDIFETNPTKDRAEVAILVTLLSGSNYPKPSRHGMSFREICERSKSRDEPRKWATHKTAVSRALWGLAEREVPLVRIWAQLLVPVYSRKHPADVNAKWFARHVKHGTWFGGSKPRIKLVALTAHGAAEAEIWSPWEQYDFWRSFKGPRMMSFGTGSRTPPGEFSGKKKKKEKKGRGK